VAHEPGKDHESGKYALRELFHAKVAKEQSRKVYLLREIYFTGSTEKWHGVALMS
jgi:hypothetical protein